MYSTYILVHPRTQQLQSALTLEDYQQIQALLEYVLQRQRQGFVQHVGDREQVRLVQALYNNKLMQLDYRRQRVAQLQRLMQHYHDQFHDCDRARLLAALEKQRAQQAFRRFIEAYYQQQGDDAQEIRRTDADNKPAITSTAPVSTTPAVADNKPAITPTAPVSTTPTVTRTETQGTPRENEEEEDQQEEPIDNAYEQYQTQQLEDLLKHIFEKNTKGQQSDANGNKEEENDEYVYAPVREDPQDEQTVADLLPLLNAENDTTTRPVDPPREKAPSPPTSDAKGDEEASYLPDNVLPLQDVLDELIRTPTPAMKPSDKPTPSRAPPVQPTKTQSSHPPVPPPKLDASEPAASDTTAHPDRQKKLDQLTAVERELDRLAAENKEGNITRLPLQYQINDQGRLFLDGNTPDNRRFLTYEDEIIRCMMQLDEILSEGDGLVRDRRRQAVRKAEALLEPVDRHKQDEWTKAQQGSKKKHRHRKRRARIPVTA